MREVILVGGGLAGLTAARALAASGRVRPQVLEASARLGGKAASWRIEGGRLVEAGLHVCFPHYRHLRELLASLGMASAVVWGEPMLSYVRDGCDVATLRFPSWSAPLHGAFALAGHRHLRVRDRFSALAGAAEATLSGRRWHERYEQVSFAHWARRRGISSRAVAGLLEPIVRGLTFLPAEEVSARAMLNYIHTVAARPGGCRIGALRGGSGEVIVEPLAADVRRRGGRIRCSSPVQALVFREGRVRGIRLADGHEIAADVVIAAVPSHGLTAIVPEACRPNTYLRDVARLQPVSVASAMLWFDRPIGAPSGIQLSPGCVFNTWADMAGLLPELVDDRRSVLQLVIAPMQALDSLNDDALVERVLSDLRRLLPGSRAARVEHAVITRTPQAFHAMTPGADGLRPPADVGIPGLLLAGDYVGAGSSPNMESAVASGLQAARLALAAMA